MKKPILIVTATFYREIADALIAGAETAIAANDLQSEKIEVPGALEIPAAIAMAIQSGRYSGYVALGCVIRGETSHYDTVCNESARGLQDLALQYLAAIGNGILTVESRAQAMERALPERKNKGGAAAQACLEMMALQEIFGVPS